MLAKGIKWLRWLTVDQYDAIDRDYLDAARPPNRQAIWILIAIALALVLPRYFGRPDYIAQFAWAKTTFAGWPHPDLYPRVYWGLFKLINYLLVPILIIKLVLKERIRDFGLIPSGNKKVWLLYLAMFLIMVPLVYLVSFTPAFAAKYPKYPEAAHSFYQLIIWELAYALQFFLLEYFFRGFALIALARHFGHLAIFVVMVPYCMIHLAKPLLETLGSIIAAVALGTLALRTRSIYGGVVLHVGVAWGMDLCSAWQKGQLQKLFSSG